MKVSTLFWGALFLIIGGLILLNNLCVIDVEWTSIFRLWPLILIFWGISLIVGKARPKWYVVVLLILIMLFMILALAAIDWYDRDRDWVHAESTHQTFNKPYSAAIERASFTLSSGAGRFYLENTTTELLDASTSVSFGKYTLLTDRSGDSESLSLRFKGRTRNWVFGRFQNRADIKLNVNPVWDVKAEIGAASLDFDLSPYKVDNLRIDAGASSLKVRLGDRADETHARIKAGVSSIEIEVPTAVGCEVRAEAPLSSKRIRGFEKIGGNTYETSNFQTAAKKIYIDIDAGVSSIRVSRYD
ncbi:MAG: hypothetical protein FJ217_07165 [Ignavibacteria bacterium]|nr:hypothetical protein [Ignavibacteria bacterium]